MKAENYDTQLGKLLLLTDMVKDIDSYKKLVVDLLGYQLDANEAITDYFQRTATADICFTIDYDGVTLYFCNGDITDFGEDMQSVTVEFEYYHEIPRTEGYHVIGVADGILPYFVKTAEGNKYIYLFFLYDKGDNPGYLLEIYDVTNKEISYVATESLGPALLSDSNKTNPFDYIKLPTNPESGEIYTTPYKVINEFPSIGIEFEPDNRGSISINDKSMDMTYTNEGGGMLSIHPENAEVIILLYYQEEGKSRGWLRMDMDDYIIYLH